LLIKTKDEPTGRIKIFDMSRKEQKEIELAKDL
jgi:hypothetical protein